MNQETRITRELRFVCPECGGNSLYAEASGYLDIDHVYDDNVFTWGDFTPEEMSDYRCRHCGYLLEMSEDVGLPEWLITHCIQDDAGAVQSEDHVLEVPESESDK